jgi:hypothetical protein
MSQLSEVRSRLVASATRRLGLEPPTPPQPPFVYLIGEPGLPNYGDDLIAAQWLTYYAARHAEWAVVVDAMDPGRASSYLWRFHPRVVTTDTVARIAAGQQFWPPSNESYQSQWILDDLQSSARRPEFSAGIELLNRHVRGVHVMGGGYISGRFPGTLGRALMAPWARERGLPFVATGLGVAPLEGAQASFIRRVLGGDHVAVRDEASRTFLPEAALLPDDVFVNALEGVYQAPPTGVRYWVSIQADMGGQPRDAIFNHVVATLTEWGAAAGDPVGIVECSPLTDGQVAPAIEDAGFAPVFYPIVDLLVHGFPAGPGQVWLSTRYHAHLLASFAGARGSYLSVDGEYYSPKHAAVKRLGSRWTESVIGGSIPEPGPAVADREYLRHEYARQVRAFVEPVWAPPRAE